MADLAEGVSSTEVQKLQKQINTVMDQTVMPENGTFDADTTKGVKAFQAKMGVKQTGVIDKATKAAMDKCMEKRCKITYGRNTYYLNKVEFAEVEAKACAALKKPAMAYKQMADNTADLWKNHSDAQKNNKVFSWIVDGVTQAKFPSKQTIDKAQADANKMVSNANSGNLAQAQVAFENNAGIRQAAADMSAYIDAVHGGGAQLIKNLETIQAGCVVTLQVSAAIATGGASWQIQAGVAGAVGAYGGLLGEIEKAGKGEAGQTVGSAVGNIILAGAIEAGIGVIMKGPKKELIDAVAKQAAKKVVGTGLKKAGGAALEKFAVKALSGGAKSAFENLVKDLCQACNPSSKMTLDKAVESMAANFAKGAVFGSLDDELTSFGKGMAKQFKASDFKGLGKVNMNEALKEGGAKALESAYDRVIGEAVEKSNGDASKVKGQLKKLILADPSVQKTFADIGKKKGKKK